MYGKWRSDFMTSLDLPSLNVCANVLWCMCEQLMSGRATQFEEVIIFSFFGNLLVKMSNNSTNSWPSRTIFERIDMEIVNEVIVMYTCIIISFVRNLLNKQ